MRYADPREEWRITDVERKADAATNRLHEIDSLRSNVDSLEHTLRETRAEIDGLRSQLETAQSAIVTLQDWYIETLSKEVAA